MIVEKKRPFGPVHAVVVVAALAAGAVGSYRLVRPYLLERAADRVLLATPAFQQIARWEPAAHQQMKDAAIASIERGDPPARCRAPSAASSRRW